MGLSQALNIATAGLRVTQASLAVVAGNVANAGTLSPAAVLEMVAHYDAATV